MLNDIYNRSTEDPNFAEGQIELNDKLELFKQQIESCLFTPKTSVMGTTDFGASLDEYVWSFITSVDDLNYAVIQQIGQYCTMSTEFTYTVDSQFFAGSIRDIAVVSIVIDNRDQFNVVVA
mgnify:CR=1 FL=1